MEDRTATLTGEQLPETASHGALPEKSQPKKIAVFCDGTWNDLRMDSRTNVARLAKCVLPTGEMTVNGGRKEVAQIVYYDEGVGVGDGVSRFSDAAVQWLGGALGRGLDAKIEKAYRFIVLNYTPGDELFIFGFSRGAYTARSLCGLIRTAGIVRRSEFERVPDAIRTYRDVDKAAEARTFRRTYSYDIIAGEEDYTDEDWAHVREFQKRVGVASQVRVIPPGLRDRGIRIRYLGVWDTVGALGVPSRFRILKRLTKDRYRFHNDRASSLVQSLRHAVSLDEERAAFDVTPFGNLEDLNIIWAAGERDSQVHSPGDAGYVPYPQRPYQQRWFPGDHGAVGGGGKELGLSSDSLLWVAEGAGNAGLELDLSAGSELRTAMARREPGADWPARSARAGLIRRIGGALRRSGPDVFDEIGDSARERWRRYPEYRPSGMHRFAGRPELQPSRPDDAQSSASRAEAAGEGEAAPARQLLLTEDKVGPPEDRAVGDRAPGLAAAAGPV